jgi:hypothetical protein
MSKTAVVRRSKRLGEMKSSKGAGEARFEEENVWNLKRTGEDIAKKVEFEKREIGVSKRKIIEKRESEARKRKRSSTRSEKYNDLSAKQAAKDKVKVIRRKKVQKEKWLCEWTLPLPALEKVFSYLDWKQLGRAMLVCHRWNEVGGHPSLWNRFPLRLSGNLRNLKRFAQIHRLGWVKSLDLTITGSMKKSLVTFVEAAIESLPRLEELFISCDDEFLFSEFTNSQVRHSIENILKTTDNKISRVGARAWLSTQVGPQSSPISLLVRCCLYYVSNLDAATYTFLKQSCLERNMNNIVVNKVVIYGLPGLHLTNEILETICTNQRAFFSTNILIDQNVDLKKLAGFLVFFSWFVDPEKQEVTPLNAILDLQGGKDNGAFLGLDVPKDLLLSSNWVGSLGGRARVEESTRTMICILHTENGLEIKEE